MTSGILLLRMSLLCWSLLLSLMLEHWALSPEKDCRPHHPDRLQWYCPSPNLLATCARVRSCGIGWWLRLLRSSCGRGSRLLLTSIRRRLSAGSLGGCLPRREGKREIERECPRDEPKSIIEHWCHVQLIVLASDTHPVTALWTAVADHGCRLCFGLLPIILEH